MNKNNIIILLIVFIIPIFFIYGCDGLFPTASKPTVPGDHTNNIKGALHKGSGSELNPDECGDCHSTDLQGKVSLINGVYTWAPSCYQCHSSLWKRNGNGNKIFDSEQ